jgi:hypothetical protein
VFLLCAPLLWKHLCRAGADPRASRTPCRTNKEQVEAFSRLNPDEQADTLRASLLHWALINQVVTLRSRWGFRERDRQIPRWLEALLGKIAKDKGLRLILISERKLPVERVAVFPHVAQFGLEQLGDETIQFILGDLIEQRFQRPEKIADIASEIHGHPATANHVAYLVNSGMSLDSLLTLPDPIHAFHDQTLDAIFNSGSLSLFQTKLLELLSWLPSLSIEVISEVFEDVPKADVVRDLWDLNAFSLITHIEGGTMPHQPWSLRDFGENPIRQACRSSNVWQAC